MEKVLREQTQILKSVALEDGNEPLWSNQKTEP